MHGRFALNKEIEKQEAGEKKLQYGSTRHARRVARLAAYCPRDPLGIATLAPSYCKTFHPAAHFAPMRGARVLVAHGGNNLAFARRITSSRCEPTPGRDAMAKYGKKASETVESAMRRKKKGTLKSSSGATVKSRKQAIAIGLSEARAKGAKVPAQSRKSSRTTKKATKKR
jgi:hypothetical protein